MLRAKSKSQLATLFCERAGRIKGVKNPRGPSDCEILYKGIAHSSKV